MQQANQATEWKRLNADGLIELNVAFNTDAVAGACVKAVASRLLGSGIVFTNKSYNKIASGEFQSHINLHFVKFIRDVIAQISVQGFACYIVDNTVPRALPIGACDLRYRLNPDTYVIDLACFREEVPDESIFIIVESEPDLNGGVVSAMSAYYTSRMFKDSCIRNALTADALNARPPVYTYTQTDMAFDERDLEGVGEVDGLKASIQRDNLLTRNKVQMTVHERQEHLVGILNRKTLNARDEEDNYRTDPLTKLQNYDYNLKYTFQPIVPLPLDARICSAPQASSRPDLMTVFTNTAHMACVCFGVNGESIGLTSTKTHASADYVQTANLVTLGTVSKFKNLLSPMLIEIYKLIWGASEDEDAGDEAEAAQSDRSGGGTTKADDITVIFPATIPSSTMEKLFLTQVLKYDAYKHYLHESLQIPVSNMEKTYEFKEPPEPVDPGQAAKRKHIEVL
jgi:hypothetical protein